MRRSNICPPGLPTSITESRSDFPLLPAPRSPTAFQETAQTESRRTPATWAVQTFEQTPSAAETPELSIRRNPAAECGPYVAAQPHEIPAPSSQLRERYPDAQGWQWLVRK